MSILSKYIIKNHTYLLFTVLGIGLGIFIIIDLVERADVFLAVEGGASQIIPFYIARLPGIFSQILPAVFLLASVILLCIMIASRESIALQAGGVSMSVLARLLMFCGIFWAIVQFFCSQLLVTYGENVALRIWREDVRHRVIAEKTLEDVWFTEGNFIVFLDKLFESGKGERFIAYDLTDDEKEINTIIRAESFLAEKDKWLLTNVNIAYPNSFESLHIPFASIPLEQSVKFFFIGNQNDPRRLDFFVLGEAIDRLELAGSNVETLQTIWFGKLAYSASIIVLAFVAVAIVTYKDNIYLAVILAIVVAFIAYVFTMLGDSLGKEGVIPPVVAAWGPQVLIFLLAYARVQYVSIRR